jgi:hypothetical protein
MKRLSVRIHLEGVHPDYTNKSNRTYICTTFPSLNAVDRHASLVDIGSATLAVGAVGAEALCDHIGPDESQEEGPLPTTMAPISTILHGELRTSDGSEEQ